MEEFSATKPDILYVDDIENNLTLFEVLFKDHFNVHLASSGSQALQMMKNQPFAVIISDQSMPEMTGTQLMEIVKSLYPDTMRFILTAYTDYNTVVDSINKGEIYGFFNKPFDTNAITSSLHKAIEVYNLRVSNRRMVTEMAQMNAELLELDRTKTRYLSILTNEIRTPINKIMSAVHMLKDRIDSGDLNELMFYLDTSVSRLESFSNAANQLTKLNEGLISSQELKPVSLPELIEVCILENKNLIDRFGVSINFPGTGEDILVKGDFSLLLSCLGTLLMNSAEHSGKDSHISIKVFSTNKETIIQLTDPGKLYSRNQVENISRFFSGSLKNNEYVPGIELTLARQIMVSHSGRVEIHQSDDRSVSTKMIFPLHS